MTTSADKIREILIKHLIPQADRDGSWTSLASHVDPDSLISDLDDLMAEEFEAGQRGGRRCDR